MLTQALCWNNLVYLSNSFYILFMRMYSCLNSFMKQGKIQKSKSVLSSDQQVQLPLRSTALGLVVRMAPTTPCSVLLGGWQRWPQGMGLLPLTWKMDWRLWLPDLVATGI